MATALDLLTNLKSLKILDIAVDAIDKTKDIAVDLNVEQLACGYDSEKKRLKKYRSKSYSDFKQSMNSLPGFGNPDLILTGAFVNSFKLDISGQNLKFSASDSKSDDLTKKYGDNIFGLGETNNEYYAQQVVFPIMMNTIQGFIGL